MRKERVILDPEEVAPEGRVELDIHKGAIEVGPEGPDWGDYEVNAFKAKRDMGEVSVDEETPNRVITVPLVLGTSGDFDAARIALAAWATRVNEGGGGWLKREIIGGSYGEAGEKLFADIVNVKLRLGGSSSAAARGLDPDAHLVLEALPDFYGEPEVLAVFEGTGAVSQVVQVRGDLPGRVDLTITEKSGKDLLGLAYHFRRRNYSPEATAAMAYEAEALTKLEQAEEATVTGASGGKAIRHNNLSTGWTPIVQTNLKAGSYLTHAGLLDVFARVHTSSNNAPWLRLVWDVGDLVSGEQNAQRQLPGVNGWYLVHLGQVNLREAPFGPHRWQGVIQGRGRFGGENVSIDQLLFFDATECSGIFTAPQQFEVPVSGYVARDRYQQGVVNGSALTGVAAETGGKSYVALPGSDPDDFTIQITQQMIRRTALSDAGTAAFKGRAVGLALGLPDMAAQIDFVREGALGKAGYASGLILKGSDASNYVRIYYADLSVGSVAGVYLEVMRGGVQRVFTAAQVTPRVNGTLMAAVAGDDYAVWLDGQRLNFNMVPAPTDSLSLLPAGGAYVYDAAESATAVNRWYDNFLVWVPDKDAVIYANRNARLATNGAYRQDVTGTAYAPIAVPGVDLPRLPVSGPEKDPVEVLLRGSRGEFKEVPDPELLKLAGQLSYRPCWSQVPGL